MKELELSIREIDDLLEHLFRRLRGKKEGLSLLEPAAVLLQNLKESNPAAYEPNLQRFLPVIIDAFISRAYISFGYDGLDALMAISPDISMISGDYIPEGVMSGLEEVRSMIQDIQSVLEGGSPVHSQNGPESSTNGQKRDKFFHECISESTFLPLVSVFNAGKSPFTLGRIVQPHIELRITGELSVRRKTSPGITFDHMFAEPGSEFEKQIFAALELAEKFAVSRLGIRDILRMPREYRLSLPEAAVTSSTLPGTMTGGSAGLSFTMLFISLLCGLGMSVKKYELIRGTAFSGILDENGTIKEVESSFVPDKVRAAFYSTCESLVLPSKNYELGLEELVRLKEEHGSRDLTLIGASNIDDCISDSRVWRRGKRSFIGTLLQKAFHWRKHTAVTVSLIFALIIASMLYTRYFDSTVTTIEHIDSLFVFTNRHGGIVNTYNFHFLPLLDFKQNSVRPFIDDFKGTGKKEIACVVAECPLSIGKPNPCNQIHFYLFNEKGEFNREFVIDPNATIGISPPYNGKNKILKTSTNQKLNKNEGIIWIVTQFTNYPPACLIGLSMVDYSFRLFFHDGYIQELSIRDADGDGVDDVVLIGWNNKLESSVIIVLDPRHTNGSSPFGSAYETPGYNMDIAKYYIKLPHLYLFKYYSKSAFGLSIQMYHEASLLSVTQKSLHEDVRYFFDTDLRCTSANITLSARGSTSMPDSVLPVEYDNKSIDEKYMADNIQYWNGSEWVYEPTVNSTYLKYLADLKISGRDSSNQ